MRDIETAMAVTKSLMDYKESKSFDDEGSKGDSCHSRVIWNQQNLYPKFLLLP